MIISGYLSNFALPMKFTADNRIYIALIICLAGIFYQTDSSELSLDTHFDIMSSVAAGDIADSVYAHSYALTSSQTECRVPRQTNIANSFRTFSAHRRYNTTTYSGSGFTVTKVGKSMNTYSSSLFFSSLRLFPSGLNESSHHLINLRKLLI